MHNGYWHWNPPVHSAYPPDKRTFQLCVDTHTIYQVHAFLYVDILSITWSHIPCTQMHFQLYLVNHFKSPFSLSCTHLPHPLYCTKLLVTPFPQTAHSHFPVLSTSPQFFTETIAFVLLVLIFNLFPSMHYFILITFPSFSAVVSFTFTWYHAWYLCLFSFTLFPATLFHHPPSWLGFLSLDFQFIFQLHVIQPLHLRAIFCPPTCHSVMVNPSNEYVTSLFLFLLNCVQHRMISMHSFIPIQVSTNTWKFTHTKGTFDLHLKLSELIQICSHKNNW